MSHTQDLAPSLVGPLVTVRAPREADVEPLLEILGDPKVSFWWGEYPLPRLRAEIIESPHQARVIEVAGECAGGMLVLRSEDPEYPTTVMHIFVATRFRGHRVGEEALAIAIRHEFSEGVSRVTLDPNIFNEGAIRVYERMGFRRIGVLRDYQVRPGGTLEDAMFMEITRSDFPDGPALPER